MTESTHSVWVACRVLTLMQLREQPLRTLTTLLAIALGVALGVAVYLIDAAALGQFDAATRRVVGSADAIVRGPQRGFDQQLFVRLARNPAVELASPALELQLSLAPTPAAPRAPLGGTSLALLAVDGFRAAGIEPSLIAPLGADLTRLLASDAVVLSRPAAEQLGLHSGQRLPVIVGSQVRPLRIVDVLPTDAYPGPLAIMDIASAQWALGYRGRLNRIDLRVRAGVDPERFRARLQQTLPPGVVVVAPRIEDARAATATRAYRVNLNMLALVALLTGAFLVFATQSLAVLRRRVALALLRALGLTRGALQAALTAEGALLGLGGSVLGLGLGIGFASLVLVWLGADLGNRRLSAVGVALGLHPLGLLGFLAIGTLSATLAAWLPAREAALRPPAAALKAGDVEPLLERLPLSRPGIALVLAGAVLAWLPPLAGLPLPGYAAIGCLLLGAVLLVPRLTQRVMQRLPSVGRVVWDTSLAQLRGSVGSSTVSLAAVIVSFSLMVAMAIMVHSFRDSFDLWLVKFLPADLQLRAAPGSDTATLSASQQARVSRLPGIARAQFQRQTDLYLQAEHPPVTLLARDLPGGQLAESLPLVSVAARLPPGAQPVWISEALQDRLGWRPGDRIELPLAGARRQFVVAGVWRDYVHENGALVITRSDYLRLTGDDSATLADLWERPGIDPRRTTTALRAVLGNPVAWQILSTSELRERSLQVFDRAFLVTYALEAVAVLIGLAAISIAASANALARRAQFGMLRHIGLLRGQVLGLLACEGMLQSALAVIYGLLLGAALSVILVYVINRQSFHWSIELAIPWAQLAALSVTLIAAAALTALVSGRAALGTEALRAVREDW